MTTEFYDSLAADDRREKRIRNLTSAGLLALCDYAESREAGDTRDDILGIALVTAAERYLRRARRKKAKRKAKARKVL